MATGPHSWQPRVRCARGTAARPKASTTSSLELSSFGPCSSSRSCRPRREWRRVPSPPVEGQGLREVFRHEGTPTSQHTHRPPRRRCAAWTRIRLSTGPSGRLDSWTEPSLQICVAGRSLPAPPASAELYDRRPEQPTRTGVSVRASCVVACDGALQGRCRVGLRSKCRSGVQLVVFFDLLPHFDL